MNIENLVYMIKKRPGMFLIRIDIKCLYQFLYVYFFVKYDNYVDNLMNKFFWNNFHDFSVNYISQKRMNYSKSSDNWCYEIRNVCNNEEEELELFFAIFKEFMDCFYKVKLNK